MILVLLQITSSKAANCTHENKYNFGEDPIFIISPNPTSDHIIVSTSSSGKILIVDMLGNMICNVNIEKELTISTLEFIDGIYFVQFYADDGSNSLYRIIVKHN